MKDSEVIKEVERRLDVAGIPRVIGCELTLDNKQYSIAIVEENGELPPNPHKIVDELYTPLDVVNASKRDSSISEQAQFYLLKARYKRVVKGEKCTRLKQQGS